MGHHELTQRILSSEALVDSTLIRNGRLKEADWARIGQAIGRLEVPLFLDDNPRVTVMEIRAKARRIKARHGALALIVIDYLQLMSAGGNPENRQLEVSDISRNLKILARELEVPIVALSQLSRNLENRSDKRPMLADLRESGCLTADTPLVRADTGAEVALGDLVGTTDVPIWSLDERYRLVPARLLRAFPSGVKPTYRLRLASGRSVDASANHPFLTVGGWRPVEALVPGEHLAAAADLAGAPVTDDVPLAVWEHVRTKSAPAAGLSMAELGDVLGLRYCAATLERFRLTRHRVARIAAATGDDWLDALAAADVVWDRIMSITALGEQPVFDATHRDDAQLRGQRHRRPQLTGAGRRRRHVPVPGRGVQQRVARQGLGRGDRGQAPFRADRHEATGVPRSVHALRRRRPRRLSVDQHESQLDAADRRRLADAGAVGGDQVDGVDALAAVPAGTNRTAWSTSSSLPPGPHRGRIVGGDVDAGDRRDDGRLGVGPPRPGPRPRARRLPAGRSRRSRRRRRAGGGGGRGSRAGRPPRRCARRLAATRSTRRSRSSHSKIAM